MKVMKKGIVGLFAVMLVFTVVQVAMAEECERCEHKGEWKEKHKDNKDTLAQELGLTEEQRVQMKALREDGKGDREAGRAAQEAINEKLRNEINKYDADSAKIQALIEESVNLHRGAMEMRVEKVAAVKKILSEEQFKVLQEKKESMKEGKGERRKEMKERFKGKLREGMGRGSHGEGDDII